MKRKTTLLFLFSVLALSLVAALMIFPHGAAASSNQSASPAIMRHFDPHQVHPNANNMTWHNGPIMPGTVNVYAIFWEPKGLTVDKNYNSLIEQYYKDVGGTGLYNIMSQYKGSNGNTKTATLAGTWLDNTKKDAYPNGAILSPADIATEVQRAMKANGWKAGASNYFPVYTSQGAGTSVSGACAWHFISNGFFYAHNVYPGSGCTVPQSPNNCNACDSAINLSSHEQFEAATDPDASTGWYYLNTAGEIGDLCNFNFGNLGLDGGKANQKWNGHFYIVQQEWNNKQSSCTQTGP